jgi:hypothetical protein
MVRASSDLAVIDGDALGDLDALLVPLRAG